MSRGFVSLFCVFLCSVACKEQEAEQKKQSGQVIVAGRFENLSKTDTIQEIGLFVQDYVTKKTKNYSQRLDSTHFFRFEFDLTEIQDVTLLPNEIIKLIVAPGDSVFIKIDAKANSRLEILKGLEISGSKAELNKKLTQFWIQDPMDYQLFQQRRRDLNGVDFKGFRDSVYTNRSAFIQNYILENSIDGELKNWLEAESLYGLPGSFSFFEVYLSKKGEHTEKISTISGHEMKLGQIEPNATKFDLNKLVDIKTKHLINTAASNRIPKLALDHSILSVYQDAQQMDLREQGPYFIENLIENFSDRPMILRLMVNDFTKSNMRSGDVLFYEASRRQVDSLLRFSVFDESLKELYEETKTLKQDTTGK